MAYTLPLRHFTDWHNAFLNIYNKSESKVLRLLISKLPRMGHFICQYIKRDGSIYENRSISNLGCSRHFNARPKKIYLICNEQTYAKTGICNTHKRIYKMPGVKVKKVKMESDMIKTHS